MPTPLQHWLHPPFAHGDENAPYPRYANGAQSSSELIALPVIQQPHQVELASATEKPAPSVQDSSVFEELLSQYEAFVLGRTKSIIIQNEKSVQNPVSFPLGMDIVGALTFSILDRYTERH